MRLAVRVDVVLKQIENYTRKVTDHFKQNILNSNFRKCFSLKSFSSTEEIQIEHTSIKNRMYSQAFSYLLYVKKVFNFDPNVRSLG